MMVGKEERYPGCLELVFGIITFGFAFFTSFAFLSLLVPPYYFAWFQWLGLCMPVLVVVNLALLVFWAIRKKKWLFLPLIALLSNFYYYPRVYQLPFANRSEMKSAPSMVFASYNVHEFRLDYGGSSLANIAELMAEKHVQVLCLQEVPGDIDKATLLKAFPSMPHLTMTPTVQNSSNIVVLSAFPIKSSHTISFPERANCALAADLAVEGKSISLLACHLQTTNWNQIKGNPNEERSFGLSFWHLFAIESVMARNCQYRALQADSLSQLVRQSRTPVIVCGDFNDTPMSYTYRKMKGDLADSFRKSGKGYTYTYRYLHKLFRIDYLFYSSEYLKARYYESPEVEYSDHKPIIIGLDWVNLTPAATGS